MPEQLHTVEKRVKRRTKTEVPAAPQKKRGSPVALPEEALAMSDGTLQGQAARLGDPRLQTGQRQALAVHIGRVQGNQHLQRVVASLKRDAMVVEQAKPGPGTVIQLKPT